MREKTKIKILKKTFTFAMMGAAGVALTACGSGKKEGTLKIGMEVGYPPFEYLASDGSTIIGVDAELGEALADELNMNVEFVDTAWDEIFTDLDNEKYDCIISAVTITDERKEIYDFTDPYIQSYQCLVALKAGDTFPADLSECEGLKVDCQVDTTSEAYITDYAEANDIDIDLKPCDKMTDCYEELENGKADIIICDSTVAQKYISEKDSKFVVSWLQNAEPEEFGICVKKGNEDMSSKLNTALKELKSNGTLDRIINNNF